MQNIDTELTITLHISVLNHLNAMFVIFCLLIFRIEPSCDTIMRMLEATMDVAGQKLNSFHDFFRAARDVMIAMAVNNQSKNELVLKRTRWCVVVSDGGRLH